MVVEDLLTLSDAELDEVAYMIGMKPFDKKRLKQQIDLANGRLPSPVQSLPGVADEGAAAQSPTPPAHPVYTGDEEKGIDLDVGDHDAKVIDIFAAADNGNESLDAGVQDMAAHEAQRFAADIDEIMRQAMEGTQVPTNEAWSSGLSPGMVSPARVSPASPPGIDQIKSTLK